MKALVFLISILGGIKLAAQPFPSPSDCNNRAVIIEATQGYCAIKYKGVEYTQRGRKYFPWYRAYFNAKSCLNICQGGESDDWLAFDKIPPIDFKKILQVAKEYPYAMADKYYQAIKEANSYHPEYDHWKMRRDLAEWKFTNASRIEPDRKSCGKAKAYYQAVYTAAHKENFGMFLIAYMAQSYDGRVYFCNGFGFGQE